MYKICDHVQTKKRNSSTMTLGSIIKEDADEYHKDADTVKRAEDKKRKKKREKRTGRE